MVSVVITTCKRDSSTLCRAIDSVVAQRYTNWELIIIDDSPSTYLLRDEVAKAIRECYTAYDIQYIQNKQNMGACYSRNVGTKLAKGEYIAFLDDDDEWLPEKLSVMVETMDKCSENTALLYTPFFVINQDTGEQRIAARRKGSGNIYEDLLIHGDYIGGMSVPLIRTACLREIGGFDEEMQSSQDYDVWLRLAYKYEIGYVDAPLTNYYVYNGERITTNHAKKISGEERIILKNREYLEKNRYAKWRRHTIIIPHYASEGLYKKALKIWAMTVVLCPLRIYKNIEYLYSIIIRINGRNRKK